MKNLVLSILVITYSSIYAQDTTKVLFIGNSFTSQNNLPEIFKQLSEGSNKKVVIASHMPGGVSVGDISQGTSAHMNNPTVYSLIRSDDWDYMVLQDNQGRFCLGYGQFPSSSLVIEGHLMLRDSLLFYHPCAHMIWFAGFGPKNGFPPYGETGSDLIDSIYVNYQYLFDTAGQIIAPIGPAFKRIISNYPTINLWASDNTHPSIYGSYLTAIVLYTTIFKSAPINSSYNPGITSQEDELLKITGYQTAIDSLNFTGLSQITPLISQSGNNLLIEGYQNCTWFLNGNLIESGNCSIEINQPGNYYASVTDINDCEYQTLEQIYVLSNLYETNFESNNIIITPNPAADFITIKSKNNNISPCEIKLYNLFGDLVLSETVANNNTNISIENLKSGMYIITIRSCNFFESSKLFIQK